MEKPVNKWPGKKSRWVQLSIILLFGCITLLISVAIPFPAEGESRPSPQWPSFVVGALALMVTLYLFSIGTYLALVNRRADISADETGLAFRNVRHTHTVLKWEEIERATDIWGGVDQWKYHRVLLVVLKDGTRHRVNAVPYLECKGSVHIREWVDYINFRCGGKELSGLKVFDDGGSLGKFSNFQEFKTAVKNEYLT